MEITQYENKEIQELIQRISGPTFKYFMKRVKKEIFDTEYRDLSANAFTTIIVAAMASMDANYFRWIENCYEISSSRKMDFESLKISFITRLNENLKYLTQ